MTDVRRSVWSPTGRKDTGYDPPRYEWERGDERVWTDDADGPSETSPEPTDDELIEIRCLWQRTDYGYISLVAAARGYGGRQLGSYQDAIADRKFAKVREYQREVEPDWPLVESVVKVPAASVEALFTDGTEIEAVADA